MVDISLNGRVFASFGEEESPIWVLELRTPIFQWKWNGSSRECKNIYRVTIIAPNTFDLTYTDQGGNWGVELYLLGFGFLFGRQSI